MKNMIASDEAPTRGPGLAGRSLSMVIVVSIGVFGGCFSLKEPPRNAIPLDSLATTIEARKPSEAKARVNVEGSPRLYELGRPLELVSPSQIFWLSAIEVRSLSDKARKGDPHAAYRLYLYFERASYDKSKSIRYLRRAAHLGLPAAKRDLKVISDDRRASDVK